MKVKVAVPHSQTNIKDTVVHKAQFSNMAVIVDLLRKHYAFPIRTLVQEYLCNARDSHREAKVKKAIDVFLPTKTTPMFKIRDYGVGMTQERLIENFISYGGSTKSNSDLQTGGFGIGSKSAFIYTNTFFVKSVMNKVEKLYEVSIATHYEGAMREISSRETKEANGVEIMIPVEKKDIASFISAFYRCTYFWTDQPINVVNLKPEELAPEYVNRSIIETSDYYFHNEDLEFFTTISYSKESIILDGIIYDISNSAPGDCEIESHVMIPKFKTGDFKVSISREAVEDGDKLRKKLVDVFSNQEKIKQNALKAIEQVVKSAPKFNNLSEVRIWHTETIKKHSWIAQGISYELENDLMALNLNTMALAISQSDEQPLCLIGEKESKDLVSINSISVLTYYGFYINKYQRFSLRKEKTYFPLVNPLFMINDLALSGGKMEELLKDYKPEKQYNSIIVINNYTHPKVKELLVKVNSQKLSELTKEKSEEIEKNKEEAKKKREEQRKINGQKAQESAEYKKVRNIATYSLTFNKNDFNVEKAQRVGLSGLDSCPLVFSKDDKSTYIFSIIEDFFDVRINWVSAEDLAFLSGTDKTKIITKEDFFKTKEYKDGINEFIAEYSAWMVCKNKKHFEFIMNLVTKECGYDQVIDNFKASSVVFNKLKLKIDKTVQSAVRKIEQNPYFNYLSEIDLNDKNLKDLRKKMGLK